MDILVSSNLERLLYHVTGSDAEVAGLMKSLNETGRYTVRPETLKAIQESFDCGWSSEEQVQGDPRPLREGRLPLRYPYGGGFPCRRSEEAGRRADGGAFHRLALQVPAQRAGSSGPHGPRRTTSRPCRRWKRLPATPLPQVSPSCARRPSGSAPSSTRLRSRRWHWLSGLTKTRTGVMNYGTFCAWRYPPFPGRLQADGRFPRLERLCGTAGGQLAQARKPEDTIVLAGDISWAMRLTDTRRISNFCSSCPARSSS